LSAWELALGGATIAVPRDSPSKGKATMQHDSINRLGRAIERFLERAGDVVGPQQRNPFLDFHRAAEAAGYPALLVVSLVSLALVVFSIALLAIVQATWTFAIAILSLVAAIGIVAGAVLAAFSDGEESAVEPADDAARAINPRVARSLTAGSIEGGGVSTASASSG
jgi:hypothetical protein